MRCNRFSVVLAIAAVALVAVATSAHAATLTTSTTAPTVDGADIAMLDLTGAAGQGKFWAGEGFAAGQTFTTGSASGGYLLNAATIRYHGTYDPDHVNNHGYNGTDYDPTKTYGVRVVTLSGTAITELLSDSVVHTDFSRAGDYLTFTLDSPFALSPDTEYGFDVRMTGSTSGWQTGIPTVSYVGDNYAGGEYYTCSQWTDGNRYNWSATDLALAIPTASRDWVFHLDMEAAPSSVIPEPSTLLIWSLLAGLGIGMGWRRRK